MENRETFDSIMQTITAGLTGDPKKDLAWLMAQGETYREHLLGKEIARACGRLMYDLLPEASRKEIDQASDNDTAGIQATLQEVSFLVYWKQPEKALSLMEGLMERVDGAEGVMFQDDAFSEYRCFREPFEEVLYRARTETKKDIRISGIPYADIYLTYGSLLVELRRYQEARTVLEKGLHWNPCWFDLRCEYIEAVKMSGDLEEYFRLSLEAFRYAFRPQDLARCYRNLGYWFVERKLYDEAVALYSLSLEFDKEPRTAQSELYYIQMQTGGQVRQPTMEQVEAMAEKYGFPVGPDEKVVELALGGGVMFLRENKPEPARYYLTIAWNLTQDDGIRKLLDGLPPEKSGEPEETD